VDPKKRGPAERATEPRLDQLMQRTRAQRTNPDAFESLATERTVKTQWHRAAGRRTQGEEEANATTLESPRGKLEYPGRGTVEPLDVVDRDDERRRGGQLAQDGHDGRRDRTLTGDRVTVGGSQQRNLERIPLRCRKRREDMRLDPRQEIRE